MRKQWGLTLVELMVVVAVMAIIATVAYPLYTNQVQKTRRADAKIALEMIAAAQERYRTLTGGYTAVLSSLDVSSALQGGQSSEGYYNVSVVASTVGFTVTAEKSSTGAQSGDDDCEQFTINQQGVKTATDGNSTNCW